MKIVIADMFGVLHSSSTIPTEFIYGKGRGWVFQGSVNNGKSSVYTSADGRFDMLVHFE